MELGFEVLAPMSEEAMRYVLDLPPMLDSQKLAQVKTYGRVSAKASNPHQNKILPIKNQT